MATVGHTVLLLTRLLSQLRLTTSSSLPLPSARRTAQSIAGPVTPSAVWYTSLRFVRSGMIGLGRSSLSGSGIYGYNWSRTLANYASAVSTTAYYFIFHTDVLYPSNGPGNRWNSLPVRCLVILVVRKLQNLCCGSSELTSENEAARHPRQRADVTACHNIGSGAF